MCGTRGTGFFSAYYETYALPFPFTFVFFLSAIGPLRTDGFQRDDGREGVGVVTASRFYFLYKNKSFALSFVRSSC